MRAIHPYLTFNGNCEEAFNFYKKAFDVEFKDFNRFSDMPPDQNFPAEAANLIMHVALPIGANTMLMGSDAHESFGQTIKTGNNFSVYVDTESEEEANRIFSRLAESGQITMPQSKTFWGSYFGMLTDKFGINWMIGFN